MLQLSQGSSETTPWTCVDLQSPSNRLTLPSDKLCLLYGAEADYSQTREPTGAQCPGRGQ